MEENQAGITALVTAYSRAYHATHDSPLIFNDFLADQLFTPQEHVFFDRTIAGLIKVIAPELEVHYTDQAAALAWVMQHHSGPTTLSRSRYGEDCLEKAVRQGVEQYVILGAGMDTFAFRRLEWGSSLHVFEVDHPVTQAMKRRRIAAAGWALPANLGFIPVDFAQEDLTDALKNSAYDPEKLTFFSWLGVTYYLSRAEVAAALRSIVRMAPAGSAMVFDYMDPEAFEPDKAGGSVSAMRDITRQTGEPMKSSFDPDGLAQDLESLGWHLEENLSPSDIEERYFSARDDSYHATEHVHFAMAIKE
jgi:methyltransferase (TIGR00027 family)